MTRRLKRTSNLAVLLSLEWFSLSTRNSVLVTSSEAGAVLLKDTSVHDYEDSSLAGFLGSFFVNHLFLHPHDRDLQLDRLIDHCFHELRPAKNVYDVDLFRYIG